MNRDQRHLGRRSPAGMPAVLATALAVLLAFAACGTSADAGYGDDAQVPAGNDRAAACTTDADCAVGSGCHRGQGVCLPFPESMPTFSVALDPPAGEALLADQFTGVPLGPDGILDLALADPVVLTGTVFHATDAQSWFDGSAGLPGEADRSEQVPGRLVATAEGRIPGTQYRSEAATTFDAPSGEWRYSLSLLPGIPYDATFIPGRTDGGDPLPPHRFPIQVTASGTLDVMLPPVETYLRVDGIVLAGDALSPVAGAVVSCRVGDRSIGTSDITAADGRFSVVLPPDAGTVVLQARPGTGSIAFPVREIAWAGGLEELRAEYSDSPLVVIHADPIPATRAVQVQILALNGDADVAVADAKVVLEGVAGGGSASAASVTDEAGIVSLTLLEGTYQMTIVPPTGSPFATGRATLDLTASNHQAFSHYLERRVAITGSVVTRSDGTPVAGATVSLLTDRSDTLPATYGGANDATFTATTDADGRFQVLVDPGRYALIVDPPSGTALARTAAPTLDLTVARDLRIPMPEGRLVRGRILSATDGRALPGSRVRLFLDLADVAAWWSLDGTTFAGELLKVADATTGADARYEAVVPRLYAAGEGGQDVPIDAVAPSNGGQDATDGGEYGSSDGFPLPPVQVD